MALDAILNDPPFDWEQIEAIWNWADLRRGGKLQERIEALDRHFVARGKTHKICPIVLLLANGKHK